MKTCLSLALSAVLLLSLNAANISNPGTFIWTNLAGGSWATRANWLNGLVAGGAGDKAYFSVLNIAANPVVTLDGARTVGLLEFGDATTASHDWTLDTGTGGPLTLQVNSGTPTIAVTNRTATLGATLAGSQGFKKTGAGTLQLSALNSIEGSVAVDAGKLTVANTGSLGFAGVAVANDAELQVGTLSGTFTNALSLAGKGGVNDSVGALHFTGGTVTWSGPITLASNAVIGSYAGSGNYTLSGVVVGTGNLTFWGGGASSTHVHTYNITAPCTYLGDTLLDTWAANTVVVLSGAPNRLPTGGVLRMMAGIWNVSPPQVLSAVLKLMGNNQTFGGLVSAGGSHGIGGTNRVVNGSPTEATLTLNVEAENIYDGFLGGSGANENRFGVIKNGAGSLVVKRASTYSGATVVNGGTLSVTGGLGGGPVTVAKDAALLLGPGPYTFSSLILNHSSVFGINLGAVGNPRNTVIQINGNLVLDGAILVRDLGDAVTNDSHSVIHYTGTLTDLGMTTDPRSEAEVQMDTSTPHQVNLRLLRLHPMVEFTNGNFAVSTTSTNLGGLLHGFPTLPLWFEVRDSASRLWDYGSTRANSPWSITVRHLRAGTNTVTIFARNAGGSVVSNSVHLTLSLNPNSPVRPRPWPAEIWWGGSCHDTLYNENNNIIGTYSRLAQLTNSAGWDFVKQNQDGFFLHGYVWVNGIARMTNWQQVGRSISGQLAPYNTKFWLEDGWRQPPGDIHYGHRSAGAQAADVSNMESAGFVLSEITQDYDALMRDFCTWQPTWPQRDLMAVGTGDTNGVSGSYPYSSGAWRDFATDFHDVNSHVKLGWTWSPVWFGWSNGPALVTDQLVFTVNVGGLNYPFHFDFADFMASATLIGDQVGVPFAFASDCPWDYYGDPGGVYPWMQAVNRKKIRDYEAWLESRELRHTLICNYSLVNAGNPDASDLTYKTNSLNSMFLHQQEGGHAARYLFESWYQGPFTVLPETKNGSYANLAMDAIKYLKGIRDTNGALEQLTLTLLTNGITSVIEMRNGGDIKCLPVLQAFESGDSGAITRYYDSVSNDITAAVLSPAGYVVTNFLQPGQATTFAIAMPNTNRTVSLEAFWNPQDPTGIVRDRLRLGPPAINEDPTNHTNLPPISHPQSLITLRNTPLTVTLTGSDPDGDSLVFSVATPPAHGSLTGAAPNLTYQPEAGYVGPDNFTFEVHDGYTNTPATVSITVVANGTWTQLAGGSWGNSANWLGGVIADGPNAIAGFSALNITGNPVVTLDGSRTVGGLEFGDATTASHDWTLNTGTGGPLRLEVSSGTPTIAVTNRTATMTASLAGSQGFKKTGEGTLRLNTSNSLTGGVTVSSGTLIATRSDSVKGAGSLSVSNGALFQFGNGFTLNVPATIVGNGIGRGALYLAQGGTFTATLAENVTLLGSAKIGTFGAFMTLNLNGNIRGTGDLNFWGGGGAVNHLTTFKLAGALSNVGAIVSSEFGCNTLLRMMAADRFSPSNTLTLNSAWNPATFATLDLNTFSQTISNLNLNGNNPKKITDSGGGMPAALTLYKFDCNGGTTYLDHVTLNVTAPGNTANSWLDGGSTVIVTKGATLNTSFYTTVGDGGDGTLTVYSNSVVRNSGELLLNYSGSGSGTINVAGGTVYSHFIRVGESTSGGTATVNLDAGTLFTDRIFGNDPKQSNVFNFNGGTLSPNTSPQTEGLNWFNSPNVISQIKNGGAVIDTAGQNVTLANNLLPAPGSSGGLIKRGAGILTLAGTNSFSGPTLLSNGTLRVSGRLQGSQVTVEGGTLGGTGVITAPVSVLVSGILAPGASIGTLTISNTLTLAGTTSVEVNKATATCDLVHGLTRVTYGGALVVVNLGGTLAVGDSFKLFEADTYLGTFASVTPNTPGAGLTWDTSSLPLDGRLNVLADTADEDGDGITNLQEFLAGTNPHSPASRLELRTPNLVAGGFSFKFNGIAKESYSILYQNSLTDPTWQKWQDVPAQNTDHVVTVNVPIGVATGRFFKVVAPQWP